MAQNYGQRSMPASERISAALVSVLIFCLVISAAVFGFAGHADGIFTNEGSAISAAKIFSTELWAAKETNLGNLK